MPTPVTDESKLRSSPTTQSQELNETHRQVDQQTNHGPPEATDLAKQFAFPPVASKSVGRSEVPSASIGRRRAAPVRGRLTGHQPQLFRCRLHPSPLRRHQARVDHSSHFRYGAKFHHLGKRSFGQMSQFDSSASPHRDHRESQRQNLALQAIGCRRVYRSACGAPHALQAAPGTRPLSVRCHEPALLCQLEPPSQWHAHRAYHPVHPSNRAQAKMRLRQKEGGAGTHFELILQDEPRHALPIVFRCSTGAGQQDDYPQQHNEH